MEHPSILKLLEYLENQQKLLIHWMDISRETGIVQHETIPDEILKDTCLVTIMQANNETGVIQPVNEIFEYLKCKCIINGYLPIFHSDASQAIGRIGIEIFDVITVTGHKFGGPCIAALLTKNTQFLNFFETNPFFYGGGQEFGYRSGTENLPMIAGLSVALESAAKNYNDFEKVSLLRDYLEKQLLEKFGAKSFYKNSSRLPNTASICFPSYPGLAADLLKKCENIFAASTGAACHSNGITISPCLLACGRSIEEASKTIRFSLGKENTKAQIDKVVEEIAKAFEA
uniref:Selenocysteine lyase n=1 Tax=Panagrolaimus davidi TaxID=227884 RepID=A0A914P599_9BILA